MVEIGRSMVKSGKKGRKRFPAGSGIGDTGEELLRILSGDMSGGVSDDWKDDVADDVMEDDVDVVDDVLGEADDFVVDDGQGGSAVMSKAERAMVSSVLSVVQRFLESRGGAEGIEMKLRFEPVREKGGVEKWNVEVNYDVGDSVGSGSMPEPVGQC